MDKSSFLKDIKKSSKNFEKFKYNLKKEPEKKKKVIEKKEFAVEVHIEEEFARKHKAMANEQSAFVDHK